MFGFTTKFGGALALASALCFLDTSASAENAINVAPQPAASELKVKVEEVGAFNNATYPTTLTPAGDQKGSQYNFGHPVSHRGRLWGIDQNGAIYIRSMGQDEPLIIFDRNTALEEFGRDFDLVPVQEADSIGFIEAVISMAGGDKGAAVYIAMSTNSAPSELNSNQVHLLPERKEVVVYGAYGYGGEFLKSVVDPSATPKESFQLFSPSELSDGAFVDLGNDNQGRNIYDLSIRNAASFLPICEPSDEDEDEEDEQPPCWDLNDGPPPIVEALGGFAHQARTYFQTIYKFKFRGNKLSDPEPLVAFEAQATTRHNGGALVYLPNKQLLFSTGDYLSAGTVGRAAPQQLDNHVGKFLLIDPDTGAVEISSIGHRNVQRIQLAEDSEGEAWALWSNIGGSAAEEINAARVADIIDTSVVENYGWGCSAGSNGSWAADGNCELYTQIPVDPSAEPEDIVLRPVNLFDLIFALFFGAPIPKVDSGEATYEGTFESLQAPNIFQGFGLGAGPADPSANFIRPLAQYSGEPAFFRDLIGDPSLPPFGFGSGQAVSGPVVSADSFSSITALFGDLYLGEVYAIQTAGDFSGTDVPVLRVNLVDEQGNPVVSNTLGGLACPNDAGACRVDPRFFTFPSGEAGVLLEATGKFYRLSQVTGDED